MQAKSEDSWWRGEAGDRLEQQNERRLRVSCAALEAPVTAYPEELQTSLLRKARRGKKRSESRASWTLLGDLPLSSDLSACFYHHLYQVPSAFTQSSPILQVTRATSATPTLLALGSALFSKQLASKGQQEIGLQL